MESSAGYVELNERPLSAHVKLLEYAGTGHRALDVGCSSGYLSGPLSRAGYTVTGLELLPGPAAAAEQFCDRVLVGDVESMELDLEPASYDLIMCGDVLEHLRDPGAALARLRPFLAPRGTLVLSTPNVANWAIRLSLLFGRFRYTDRGLLDRTHTHFFTAPTLRETLEGAGFRVETFDLTVPVPVKGAALERAAHAIGALRPGLFAYQFVVRAHGAST